MTADMKDKLELIAKDNGSEVVMLKLAEECSEYAAAVAKCLIGEGSREEVLKELADVRVVDRQADIVMHPEEVIKVHEIMEYKIDRQVERIQARKQKTGKGIEMEELKPCPFCGGEAYFRMPTKIKGTAFCSVSVECKRCGASPYETMVYEGEDDANKKLIAVKHWNRRVKYTDTDTSVSRGDNIRRMLQTDEGLADFMLEHNICDGTYFCSNAAKCDGLIDNEESIPDEWCRQCLIKWLKEEKV